MITKEYIELGEFKDAIYWDLKHVYPDEDLFYKIFDDFLWGRENHEERIFCTPTISGETAFSPADLEYFMRHHKNFKYMCRTDLIYNAIDKTPKHHGELLTIEEWFNSNYYLSFIKG